MSKSTRKAIAQRRARARRRKRITITAALVLVAGGALFFVAQNRAETAQKYAEIDPRKSKGDLDAPVLVLEYGDFQ